MNFSILYKISVCFFAATVTASADSESSVNSAFALCAVMDWTGLTSKPCEVSGWGSEVIATIDMDSAEARKLCPQIAAMMGENDRAFDNGWTLQIKSPYSNGNTIAYCPL